MPPESKGEEEKFLIRLLSSEEREKTPGTAESATDWRPTFRRALQRCESKAVLSISCVSVFLFTLIPFFIGPSQYCNAKMRAHPATTPTGPPPRARLKHGSGSDGRPVPVRLGCRSDARVARAVQDTRPTHRRAPINSVPGGRSDGPPFLRHQGRRVAFTSGVEWPADGE